MPCVPFPARRYDDQLTAAYLSLARTRTTDPAEQAWLSESNAGITTYQDTALNKWRLRLYNSAVLHAERSNTIIEGTEEMKSDCGEARG